MTLPKYFFPCKNKVNDCKLTQSYKISKYQKPSLGLQKTPHYRHPSERLGMVS